MNDSREDDLRMLRDALALDSVKGETREAFDDMLESLETRRTLSDRQRAWVRKVLDEPDYENAISSGKVARVLRHNHGEAAACTAECPMWIPPTLRDLPKRPPSRRS